MYVVLFQPAVLVGRSAWWQGRQVEGVALPAAWRWPPDQAVVEA